MSCRTTEVQESSRACPLVATNSDDRAILPPDTALHRKGASHVILSLDLKLNRGLTKPVIGYFLWEGRRLLQSGKTKRGFDVVQKGHLGGEAIETVAKEFSTLNKLRQERSR